MEIKSAQRKKDGNIYLQLEVNQDEYNSIIKIADGESKSATKTCYAENGGQVQDVGVTKQPEKPEDLPRTITVITKDFIQLITLAGSLCHPKAPDIYKQRMEGEIRKIALRHHINYVGEIKKGDSRFSA